MVAIELSSIGEKTNVLLTQDKNENEQNKEDSENNWKMMLSSLKKLLEKEVTSK